MSHDTALLVSVQNLIDFSFRSGNLGSGIISSSRAVEGTKGHQLVRKALMNELPEGSSYACEVPVSYVAEGKNIIVNVTGRIDGIIISEANTSIHEIKTTTLPLFEIEPEHNPRHWMQAKCYAFIYACNNELDTIDIRLTYYNLDNKEDKSFIQTYSFSDLKDFFLPLVDNFLKWQEQLFEWKEIRNNSIKELSFPYSSYRKGQYEFAGSVYKSIKNDSILFAQAPTGTGKTIASLFPAIKAMGEGIVSKIFYLTSKTTTKTVAEKSINDIRACNVRLKTITITAKEKICLNDTYTCDPELCCYAADYYGKVDKAIREALKLDCIDRMLIEETAELHKVCPFELSLDLSLLSDVIICDYNYLFDPRVNLKRFFMSSKNDYCFLIDEAHNLVDRARDMYSAEINKRAVFELRNILKNELPQLYIYLDQIYKYILKLGKELAECSDEETRIELHVKKNAPFELAGLLERFNSAIDNLLSRGTKISYFEELSELFFKFQNFIKINELYDDKYLTYYEKSSRDLKIKLFCIDPSKLLRQAMDKGKASVLFSATLSPVAYFARMLGGDENSKTILLPSPFLKENLCVFVDDTITTKYKTRSLSYETIAKKILLTASVKIGNYMVFFPSFEYLREVLLRFQGIQTGIRTLYQIQGMSEAAREDFLNEFDHFGETSLVGFAVLGGIFGEGIDLTGEKLSGAIIVGVGLPLLCNERNIIRGYFDEHTGNGFQYSYLYPGMNRVLQAAGRVIRTENDIGVIVLLDERFSNYGYKELLPQEWHPLKKASDGCDLEDVLLDFWG